MVKKSFSGLWIGIVIIGIWFALLSYSLNIELKYSSPWTYALMFLQMHLYTGLFITSHDAMHGTVLPSNQKINHFVGRICAVLFMFNNYNKMLRKHHEHHKFVGTDKDPDFHKGNENFFVWFYHFAKEYVSIWQILLAAGTFNLLKLIIPGENLVIFWIIPSFMSMFQLFFFGTYLPHRGLHDEGNIHHSRSQKQNHFIAFVTCYFFGYHYEHHDSPHTPWWQLWKKKTI